MNDDVKQLFMCLFALLLRTVKDLSFFFLPDLEATSQPATVSWIDLSNQESFSIGESFTNPMDFVFLS